MISRILITPIFFAIWMIAHLGIYAQESRSGLQEFALVAEELRLKSEAILQGNELRVHGPEGQTTVYRREPRYDSNDQQWIAYFSASTNQYLRWPASNSGNMQIGRRQGNSVTYKTSRMKIQSLISDSRVMGRPVLPPPAEPALNAGSGQVGEVLAELAVSKLFDLVSRSEARGREDPRGQLLRIVTTDSRGTPWLLSHQGVDLRATSSNAASADWWVAPAGNGYVRVQTYQRGKVYAVSATGGRGLALVPVSQQPHQVWRVGRGRHQNQFWLESLAFPGWCLTHVGRGGLAIQRLTFATNQMWSPYVAPAAVGYQPYWKTVRTEVLPNQDLPPAEIELSNSHRYALVVLIGDSRNAAAVQQIRIEAGQAKTVEFERDAGATLVETVEIRDSLGGWHQEQYVTAIPSQAFYDLSVYEEHLQSIAIDATGTSPNPIEDVNYVPKSVGWLPLPSGESMPARGRIDLYAKAKAAKNPGAVRRMDPEQFDEPPAQRPLENILDRFDSAPRRKF